MSSTEFRRRGVVARSVGVPMGGGSQRRVSSVSPSIVRAGMPLVLHRLTASSMAGSLRAGLGGREDSGVRVLTLANQPG